jgi:hypothetical protein
MEVANVACGSSHRHREIMYRRNQGMNPEKRCRDFLLRTVRPRWPGYGQEAFGKAKESGGRDAQMRVPGLRRTSFDHAFAQRGA